MSGFGLAAQRTKTAAFVASRGAEAIARFNGVELRNWANEFVNVLPPAICAAAVKRRPRNW